MSIERQRRDKDEGNLLMKNTDQVNVWKEQESCRDSLLSLLGDTFIQSIQEHWKKSQRSFTSNSGSSRHTHGSKGKLPLTQTNLQDCCQYSTRLYCNQSPAGKV